MAMWLDIFERVASSWTPTVTESVDLLSVSSANAFCAMLDEPSVVTEVGDPLPPLWHWFLHLPSHAQSALGHDGHPRAGPLLPPLPNNRRRMFGGGRLEVVAPLHIGDEIVKRSEVVSVRAVEGGSGPFLITTLRHTLIVDDEIRVIEEQDIVYLPPRGPSDTRPIAVDQMPQGAVDGARTVALATDPVLLFRFSALTANTHRIHYERAYAQEVEGHPDLVVQGPLSALVLLELPRRLAPNLQIRMFEWRAHRPTYVGQTLVATWALTGDYASFSLAAGPTADAVAATATMIAAPAQP